MIKKLLKRVFGKTPRGRMEGKCHIIPFEVHGVSRDGISPAARKAAEGLHAAGYKAFVVGGAVRDLLLGRHPKDFDIATHATPEDQSPWSYPPQSFYVNVEVHPEYQQRGIGSALYDQVMEGLQAFKPPALRADAFTNLPGFTFLKKRGFYEAFRKTPVHLNVASFDPIPYKELEPRLNSQGIFIKTVTELKSDPNRDRKIYELMCAVDADVPHEGDQITEPDFDDWLGWGLNDPSVLQDAYLIAVHGDQYVGLRDLGNYADREALLGGLLGVRRDYRKRGIALAMQLRNIAYAREHGYRLLKDCTAIHNAPIQALFNQLGFTRDPEWQQCQKDFG